MTLQVKVVSPERLVYDGEAVMVVCRTTDGEIAFQTGHAPFIGLLGIGPVRAITASGNQIGAAVRGGFVEVSDNRVSVLSDVAVMPDDIDATKAESDRADAERRLAADHDDEAAASDLRWAEVRLEVASGTTDAGAGISTGVGRGGAGASGPLS
jgi:F-type H+-transporting ATPase subunit epsilon